MVNTMIKTPSLQATMFFYQRKEVATDQFHY